MSDTTRYTDAHSFALYIFCSVSDFPPTNPVKTTNCGVNVGAWTHPPKVVPTRHSVSTTYYQCCRQVA